MTDEPKGPAPLFTEAPASWNTKYLLDGFECQLTLRAASANDLIPRTIQAIDWLKEHGAQPTRLPNGSVHVPAPATVATPQPAHAPQPAAAAQAAASGAAEVIQVSSVAHCVSKNGKDFIQVKGGKYVKFGIPAWEEVVPVTAADWQLWQVNAEYQPPAGMEYAMVQDKKVTLFRTTVA